MDSSKLTTFTLKIDKLPPNGATATAFLQARVDASVLDLGTHWAALRSQILGDPTLAGYSLAPKGEDLTLTQSQGMIQATLRLVAPAPVAVVPAKS